MKPLLTALLLPPLPFLLLAAVGAVVSGRRQRRLGSALSAVGLGLVWLSGCLGAADALEPQLLRMEPALSRQRIEALAKASSRSIAIIALGSGVERDAPEYHTSSLMYRSLERLRYAVWLGAYTGRPVGFSGGLGWAQRAIDPGLSEAAVAQRIATEEFHRPLRWVEAASRDTRENAKNTVALLRREGVTHIVLVTHHWHMPRSVRNFERAAAGSGIRIEPAPIGFADDDLPRWMHWLPSGQGYTQSAAVVREWLGGVSGA